MNLGTTVAHAVQRLGYGLDDLGSVLGRSNDGIFFLRHRVPLVSGVYQASYTMGSGGS